MKIVDIDARWLRCPIPEKNQHVSDFGRQTSFDMVLVKVTSDEGVVGYGEAKASVGSSASCGALVSAVLHDLKPKLLGLSPFKINEIWELGYNDTRANYALSLGRAFPTLGRRGLLISALSGIDMALWDLKGRALGLPISEFLGGACHEKLPAYASGGWAGVEAIGEQLLGYTKHGFKGVKMRVGVMDASVDISANRVRAARKALGPDIKLMADAHGTYSVSEAKRFCRLVEDCNLYWFEEPVNSDSIASLAEIRAFSSVPIAVGESQFTRFDMRDILLARGADYLQPDPAIVGGITEMVKIAHLAETFQVALAPHSWGSALSFSAATSVAFTSPASVILEFSLGANPLLHQLVREPIACDADGCFHSPTRPGLGLTVDEDFVAEFTQRLES